MDIMDGTSIAEHAGLSFPEVILISAGIGLIVFLIMMAVGPPDHWKK